MHTFRAKREVGVVTMATRPNVCISSLVALGDAVLGVDLLKINLAYISRYYACLGKSEL